MLLMDWSNVELELTMRCFMRVYIFFVNFSSGSLRALNMKIQRFYLEWEIRNWSITDLSCSGYSVSLLMTRRILSRQMLRIPI